MKRRRKSEEEGREVTGLLEREGEKEGVGGEFTERSEEGTVCL